MSKLPPAIVWFRSDLRLSDNAALTAAAAGQRPVLPIYILDDDAAGRWALGGASRWWLHHSLVSLAASLEACGATLMLARGKAADVLPALMAETGANEIHAGRAHEPWARAVETALADILGERLVLHRTATLFDLDTIKTGGGTPYGVYTPFAKSCRGRSDVGDPLPAPGAAPEADALVTAVPGILLGIQAADCVPILLVDTRLRVVAAVHAGWRGTAAANVEGVVAHLRQHFNSRHADLRAAIGPSIGACCYTVGEEVRERFDAAFAYAPDLFQQQHDGLHLNLAEANRRQLLAAGLAPGAIDVTAECTACARVGGQRKFFSHRAEAGFTGRAMGIIGIAPFSTA